MKSINTLLLLWDWKQKILKTAIVVLCLIPLCLGLGGWALPSSSEPIQISMLAQGDAITDPKAILRYSLPIDNPKIRRVQKDIESTYKLIKLSRSRSINSALKDANFVMVTEADEILAGIPQENLPQGQALLEDIKKNITEMEEMVGSSSKSDLMGKREEILHQIGIIEEMMVQGFPYEIPKEYAQLPRLLGRATVEMSTSQGDLTIVLDGYSAPINAGNFVDLVQRGFYDGLDFIRAEDFFVIQSGDPVGEANGFIDPTTNQYRAIPLEVLVKKDPAPIYGTTLEDAGLYLPDLALPFSAYGAVALASPPDDPNGGSSQFFFFKFDNEVTPPGFNLMDGRYSIFGYVVKGEDVLDKLTAQDKIISAKVVKGAENFQAAENVKLNSQNSPAI